MELRHLRYFVAVAEERHFGRAARRLHIAQPPLSRQIQMLESELGFSLFDRSRRQVELTSAGTVLLRHARHVFEAIDLAVHEARRASKGESGRLVVGYPSSLAYSGLTELLRAYRARFPEVEVVLREMPPQHQIDSLKRGEIDVGFIRGRIEDAAITVECVRREPLVVALPAEHPLAGRARVKVAQLAHDPFVIFPRDRGPAFFDQIVSMCHDAGFTPRIAQQAPQLDLVSLVAAGFGVSIVPESLRLLGRDGIAFRPLVGAPVSELLAAWRSGEPSPAVHEFVAIVRAHLKRPPASAAS
jgi:DNA-binding transcriptional LysR family regulator